MKKPLKFLMYVFIGIILLLVSTGMYVYVKGIPTYDPPQIPELIIQATPEMIEEGARISSMLCSSCHIGKDGKLSGGFMKDLDPIFGKVWVSNITNHPQYGIGKWSAGEIAYFLRTGLRKDGRYAPMWMPKFPRLSDKDLESVIAFLKSDYPQVQAADAVHPAIQASLLSKFLTNFVFKPLEFPKSTITAPDSSDALAYGEYMTLAKIECFSCHSADFKKLDIENPTKSMGFMGGGNTLLNLDGQKIYSANITMDKETGIGNWTYEQFYTCMKEGRRPDGKLLRYPMLPLGSLKDHEIKGIWTYLQTVPVIRNQVDRTGL